MPEESNRRIIDCVSDLYFVSEESGVKNLLSEGAKQADIYHVGNILVDAIKAGAARVRPDDPELPSGPYGVLTLHRQGTVDRPELLSRVLTALQQFSEEANLPLVFPVHPRTMARGPLGHFPGIRQIPPQGYGAFLDLLRGAKVVFTDSGGVQVEACALRVPCVTLRDTTEHLATLQCGNNRLATTEPDSILREARFAIEQPQRFEGLPPLWDGKTADRIVKVLWHRDAGRDSSEDVVKGTAP
jgi:UDP-N-acetylglucosamine 2-epimerase (non-hydrolysing)